MSILGWARHLPIRRGPAAAPLCWAALLVAGLVAAANARPREAVADLTAPAAVGSSLRRIQDAGVLRWGLDPAGGAPFTMPDPRDPSRQRAVRVKPADDDM